MSPMIPHAEDEPSATASSSNLVVRQLEAPADYPAMVRVNNRSRETGGSADRVTLDAVTATYEHLSGSDRDRDVFIAAVEGNILGYARIESLPLPAGGWSLVCYQFVDPSAMPTARQTLLEAAERRALEIAAGQGSLQDRDLQILAHDGDAVATQAVRSRGYHAVRRFYDMERTDLQQIPEVPLPEGLEIRPVQEAHLRAIFDASNEAFRDHWGTEGDDSEAAWAQFLADPTFDPSLWRVAWDGEQVAGQVRAFIDPEENAMTGRLVGHTESISVRRPWRRRGLARALLAASLVAIRERGMTSAALGVDGDSDFGAPTLYGGLGFEVVASTTAWARPLTQVAETAR